MELVPGSLDHQVSRGTVPRSIFRRFSTFFPGNIFVHEWAKLRYGVFEEHGYPGDPLYPMYYFETTLGPDGLTNELQPNFCTDRPLQGLRE